MLLPTMNNEEVNSEILKDWDLINSSHYLDRVGAAYDKLRRKAKVNSQSRFCKSYEFKSKCNNNWIFIFSKAPSENKYKGIESITYCSLIFYYTDIGLRVFKIVPNGTLSVFNGHVFRRYNERMNLSIVNPLEMVKHFFSNNGFSTGRIIPKEGKEYIISVCKDGLILGNPELNRTWMVYKTFVDRSLTRYDQEELEIELLNSLKDQIDYELNNNNDFDELNYKYKADVIKGITK